MDDINILKKLIRDIIIKEANLNNDKYYYKIADDFYEKMIIELENGNYIIQNDGNKLFKASEINTNYSDLLILFTKRYDGNGENKIKIPFGNFKGGYSIGTYKQYKVIVLDNLLEHNDYNPSKAIDKDSFIHEFIHYLDYTRIKNKNYKTNLNPNTKVEDYYNSPLELNAYYQEAASYIVKLFDDNESILIKFREKYSNDFNKFRDWMFENVFEKDFIRNLTPKSKEKIIKRIYNIYEKYLK